MRKNCFFMHVKKGIEGTATAVQTRYIFCGGLESSEPDTVPLLVLSLRTICSSPPRALRAAAKSFKNRLPRPKHFHRSRYNISQNQKGCPVTLPVECMGKHCTTHQNPNSRGSAGQNSRKRQSNKQYQHGNNPLNRPGIYIKRCARPRKT